MTRANYKIGIDANRPVDPQSGAIAPQVADPAIIADTGAGWVRLNFVVSPWSGPEDSTRHEGRTWDETYGQIVSGLQGKDLQIYGLISSEAVGQHLGDQLRDAPPAGTPDSEWIRAYVANFLAIVRLFHQEITLFESFNEPDDWHGSNRNWVHPGWFAIMLQRIYEAVRSDPALDPVRLVSGPLQGLAINNNGAAAYLQHTYQEGKARFDWGKAGVPFPFDGIGYHLYITEQFKDNLTPAARQQELRDTYHRYMDGMRKVIRGEEGRDKSIFISEMGWHSNRNPEEFQADALRLALELVLADPSVELAIWFCTQDFGPAEGDKFYGLYRPGPLTTTNRKPAFLAYQELCARPLNGGAIAGNGGDHPVGDPVGDGATAPVVKTFPPANGAFDNRTLIQAISLTAAELGQDRYELFERANLWNLFFDRAAPYQGPAIDHLPGFTSTEASKVTMKLNALRSGALSRRGETTADLLNLRAGPGTDQGILTQLPPQTPLAVFQEQGDWLRVEAKGQEGFVHRKFVAILDEMVTPGYLRNRPELAKIPLAPPVEKLFLADTAQTPGERQLVWIWNQYGRLLAALADELKIDPALAVAVLVVESGGKTFASDQRMVIRFENHIFYEKWGAQHAEQFKQHFEFNRTPRDSWKDHTWRPSPNSAWQPQHIWGGSLDANQRAEWDAFNFAASLAPTAARLSISMGAPQIMGFNYSVIGYESVEEMFNAFNAEERAQFFGFFDFIKNDPGRVQALQRHDYIAFASSYNGPGQAAHYGALIREQVELFDKILARQGAVSFDINPNYEVDTAAISFLPPLWPILEAQVVEPEPVMSPPGNQTGGAEPVTPPLSDVTADDGKLNEKNPRSMSPLPIDDELKDAWHQHMRSGLENNNVMFNRILQGFMIPYYLTVVLYLVLFIVGIGLFVTAARLSGDPATQSPMLLFAGLGVVTFLTFFISNPLRALEENLQFITWLGIVYNTYWTRLLYMQDRTTIHTDLEDATQDAIREIERMITANVELAKGRSGPSLVDIMKPKG